MNAEQLFSQQLDLIDSVVRSICRRHACFGDEAEDFASWVNLKLIDNDYAILSKFQGKSSLKTYLTTVIHNLFRDYRIAKWGKWRPSSYARRQGDVAIQLEALLKRDGYPLREAIEILKSNFGVGESREQLESMAAQFPERTNRKPEDVDSIPEPAIDGKVDQHLREEELARTAAKSVQLVEGAMRTLPAEDRLILKMRYRDGFTVASIASALDLEPRPLYRRIKHDLQSLRQELESRGLSSDEARDLFGNDRWRISWEKPSDVSV